MTVAEILEMIKDKPPHEEIAMVFFEKEEFPDTSDKEWEAAVSAMDTDHVEYILRNALIENL